MADREETKLSQSGEKEKEAKATSDTTNVPEEESSASEYEEIIEEVTDYSEAESEVEDTETVKEKEKSNVVTEAEEKSLTVTTISENSSSKRETTVKEEVSLNVEEAETKVKTESRITNKSESESEIEKVEKTLESKDNDDEDQVDSSEKGESIKPMLHDKVQPQAIMPQEVGISKQSTNSQKLKSAQISKQKTNSESSSMQHAPFNKTQRTSSTAASSTSQNPIVTVQTAGRTDSTSISNSSKNSSSLGGNSVAVGSDSPRQVDRLGVPQKEDSGTESGEDLRLIAAGLRDQLQIQSDSNIIEDVTGALSRLENSLKEGKDISVDLEKRKALLALVDRLRAGLTSPEKLAEIAAAMSELDGAEGLYGETSSPEADAHRSNRSRFAKRRNRINRHTVGVSREELADARRYMEDMIIISNMSQSTTPEVNNVNNNSPPQWYPIEKNASMGAILSQQSPTLLQRPKQFVIENSTTTNNNKLNVNNGNKRRPLSGEYSVTFEPATLDNEKGEPKEINPNVRQFSPTEDTTKFARFANKKHLMKRANTIDLAKTHKYNSEFDTDSDAEDKGSRLGLKRTVQVSVKKRVQNVLPPFEPKTENDRKFLAFINKQSDRPGLGWTNSSRSVSNWTNKFGSIKSTFEGGLAGKPPQAPHHVSSAKPYQSSKLFNNQQLPNSSASPYITTNQQIALRLQQEAERQAEERRRKQERERLEYERRERDKLERQRQQRERQERERLEREHFERQRREQDQIAAAQHAAILREQEQLAAVQKANSMNVAKPMPINEFKHAPQSVFRPIDAGDSPVKPIYKPIAQLPRNSSNWQPVGQRNNPTTTTLSPSQYGNARPDDSFITSPPPSGRSPIALPWASKPTVDSSGFKTKANRFEERSKYDNINNNTGPYLQRHNSLRSASNNSHQNNDDFRKRPSLPNTFDPYNIQQMPVQQDPLAYLPPPQNISFTYSDLKPKVTYQSYPCLPTAVVNNYSDSEYQRSREDSLTNPHSVPLVLTSSNPSYCPPEQQQLQQQQQLNSQPYLHRSFDIVSPADSTPTSPTVRNMLQTDCTDDDIDSDNMLEYHAVSRVMGKPQSQTAVRVGRRTGHVSDDELFGKNSKAARSLLSTMKNINNSNSDRKPNANAPVKKRPEEITSPKLCLSPDGRSYQAPIVEPLFPEVTKFETNRKPLYIEQSKNQTAASSYTQKPAYEQPTANRKQLNMYKSLENLNRTQTSSQANFLTSTQCSPKPYVSESQASYVVTYPRDDTTDDEDFSSHTQKKMMPMPMPPNSLDLRRQRNISENSTGSSTATSMSLSYSHNLPSPNTSWTSNPIVADEPNNYQNMQPAQYQSPTNNNIQQSSKEPTYQAHSQVVSSNYSSQNMQPVQYQSPNNNIQQSSKEPTYQAHSQVVSSNYSSLNQNPIMSVQPQTNYVPAPMITAQQLPNNQSQQQTPPAQQFEAQTQRQLPMMAAQQLPISQTHHQQLPTNQAKHTLPQKQIPTSKSSYEAQPQRQLQQRQAQNSTNQKQTSKTTYEAQSQKQLKTLASQQQQTERTPKPSVTQKPTDYAKPIQNVKTTAATTSTTQQKKSLVSMRKSVSEDHSTREQMSINPQNSNIAQEMISRLDQQRERISSEVRRKSLGNALDFQMEKQARYQIQQEYKSSAPLDTPDIVKSSLPKDENQPILKKFGPPQRHHYMPNAYQSPTANTTVTNSNTTQSTKIHTKNVQASTILKTSQRVLTNTRPTVVETAATPQPDDDYIPRNIVYNNVHAFTTLSRRQDEDSLAVQEQQQQQQQIRPNRLSKSDSWNQIIQLQNQQITPPSPKFNQSPTNDLRRSKSGHTLALPKMYEAKMTRTDISEKQKTVAAYFSGQKSPIQQEMVVEQQQQQQIKRSVVNRTKTSEKVSAASRKSLGSSLPIVPGALTRSATMPHIANLNLLDETNVEDAFEQLIMGS